GDRGASVSDDAGRPDVNDSAPFPGRLCARAGLHWPCSVHLVEAAWVRGGFGDQCCGREAAPAGALEDQEHVKHQSSSAAHDRL
ncbi:hypothetical protein ABTF50_19815, partial [Acinetobacter baumannii]